MKPRTTLLTVCIAFLANQARAEVDFVKDIKPILEQTCLKCHAGEKPRGALLLDTKEHMLKGGKNVKVVMVAGKAAESPMYKLVSLPEDDENRMPPLTEKALPKASAEKLRDWINEGAKWPDGIVLRPTGGATETVKEDPGLPITDAEKAAVAKLEKAGVLALRLAQNTTLLRVDFSLRGNSIKEDELALLKDMPNLTELSLAGTNITDAGLAQLKGLKKLSRLHLQNTKISDAGLENLKELTNLYSLNLYGDAGITDAGLEHLKALKGLKKLYVWQTKVTEPAAKKLGEAIAGIAVDRGYEEPPKKEEPKKETPKPKGKEPPKKEEPKKEPAKKEEPKKEKPKPKDEKK